MSKKVLFLGGIIGATAYCKVFHGAGVNEHHPDMTGKVVVITGGNSGNFYIY